MPNSTQKNSCIELEAATIHKAGVQYFVMIVLHYIFEKAGISGFYYNRFKRSLISEGPAEKNNFFQTATNNQHIHHVCTNLSVEHDGAAAIFFRLLSVVLPRVIFSGITYISSIFLRRETSLQGLSSTCATP